MWFIWKIQYNDPKDAAFSESVKMIEISQNDTPFDKYGSMKRGAFVWLIRSRMPLDKRSVFTCENVLLWKYTLSPFNAKNIFASSFKSETLRMLKLCGRDCEICRPLYCGMTLEQLSFIKSCTFHMRKCCTNKLEMFWNNSIYEYVHIKNSKSWHIARNVIRFFFCKRSVKAFSCFNFNLNPVI